MIFCKLKSRNKRVPVSLTMNVITWVAFTEHVFYTNQNNRVLSAWKSRKNAPSRLLVERGKFAYVMVTVSCSWTVDGKGAWL